MQGGSFREGVRIGVEGQESVLLPLCAAQKVDSFDAMSSADQAAFRLLVQRSIHDLRRQYAEEGEEDVCLSDERLIDLAFSYAQRWQGNTLADFQAGVEASLHYDLREAITPHDRDLYGERIISREEEIEMVVVVGRIQNTGGWQAAAQSDREIFHDLIMPFLDDRVNTLYAEELFEFHQEEVALIHISNEEMRVKAFRYAVAYISSCRRGEPVLGALLRFVSVSLVNEEIEPMLFPRRELDSTDQAFFDREDQWFSKEAADRLVIGIQDSGGCALASDWQKQAVYTACRPIIFRSFRRYPMFKKIRRKLSKEDWPGAVVAEARVIILELVDEWRRPSIQQRNNEKVGSFFAYVKTCLRNRLYDHFIVNGKRSDAFNRVALTEQGRRSDLEFAFRNVASDFLNPEQILLIEEEVRAYGGVEAIDCIRTDDGETWLEHNQRLNSLVESIQAQGGWNAAEVEDQKKFRIELRGRVAKLIEEDEKVQRRVYKKIKLYRAFRDIPCGDPVSKDDMKRIVFSFAHWYTEDWRTMDDQERDDSSNPLSFWSGFVHALRRKKIDEYLKRFPVKPGVSEARAALVTSTDRRNKIIEVGQLVKRCKGKRKTTFPREHLSTIYEATEGLVEVLFETWYAKWERYIAYYSPKRLNADQKKEICHTILQHIMKESLASYQGDKFWIHFKRYIGSQFAQTIKHWSFS